MIINYLLTKFIGLKCSQCGDRNRGVEPGENYWCKRLPGYDNYLCYRCGMAHVDFAMQYMDNKKREKKCTEQNTII